MRRTLKYATAILLPLALATAVLMLSRPRLDEVLRDVLPSDAVKETGLRATYFGISTLLISDGETNILIDGYFTRLHSPLDAILNRRIVPDEAAIETVLASAGIDHLDAVLVQHSHFDHALDAPHVAARTGAVLMGSESTLNIARGAGLDPASMRPFTPGEPVAVGAFTLTVLPSRHVALPVGGDSIGKTIDRPLIPPARLWDYVEGGTYAFLLSHPMGRILFHGSAGWRPGQYDDIRADILFLGVGGLDARDKERLDAYVAAVADASGARLVIPIHFEDLFPGADFPRLPMRAMGDAGRLIDELARRLPGRFGMLAYGRPTPLVPPARP